MVTVCHMFVGLSFGGRDHIPGHWPEPWAQQACPSDFIGVDVHGNNYAKLFWSAACSLTGEQTRFIYFLIVTLIRAPFQDFVFQIACFIFFSVRPVVCCCVRGTFVLEGRLVQMCPPISVGPRGAG